MMSKKAPSIKTRCIADQYAGPGERIAEITFADGTGCLLSVRDNIMGKSIEIYRADPGIIVRGAGLEAETGEDS
jgi:hypothetical protein